MLVKSFFIRMREDKELKAPRHASAAAIRNGNLPSRDGSLPYVTVTCLIPNTGNSSFIVAIYIDKYYLTSVANIDPPYLLLLL